MPAGIFHSFSKGEIAPSFHARVTTPAYHSALATARNLVIHASGGASNRAGLQFLGGVRHHDKITRLIPFRFKATDTYMLELGEGYARPIRNDSYVLEDGVAIVGISTGTSTLITTSGAHSYSDGDEVVLSGILGTTELNGRRFYVDAQAADTYYIKDQATQEHIDSSDYGAWTAGGYGYRIYTISMPYQEEDLRQVKYVQSADVMTLTHPSYEVRQLSRTDHDAWTSELASFAPDQTYPLELSASVGGTSGGTQYQYQVTAINSETGEESLPGLNSFEYTITGATNANPCVVTSASHGMPDGDEIEISGMTLGMTELNGRRFRIANTTTDTFELTNAVTGENINSTDYGTYRAGEGVANRTFVQVLDGNATLSSSNYVDVAFNRADEANRYKVYKREDGLWGFLWETEELTFRDDGSHSIDFEIAPPQYRTPFLDADNHPGTTNFYQQRQVYGGTNNKPDTSYYSKTGSFYNMTLSTPGQDDDAITATLVSGQVDVIRHYVALNDLLVLTSGGEWKIASGTETGFTANSIKQSPQSSWGCGHQRPVVVGSIILFVQENNKVVRTLGYALDIDGYTGNDMTFLAQHIFRDYEIVDMAYAKGTDPMVACVREDGKCGVFTFDPENEVIAWSVWDTPGGKFESVASLRPSTSEKDEAFYFVVRRVDPDGNVTRNVERVHARTFLSVQDAFFVDSGVTYDEPLAVSDVSKADPCVITTSAAHGLSTGDEIDVSDIEWVGDENDVGTTTQPDQLNDKRYTITVLSSTTLSIADENGDVDSTSFNAYVSDGNIRKVVRTITGGDHLKGQSVVALANGNVVRGLTVSSTGSITLPFGASRIHYGLNYVSDWETLNIEPNTNGDQTLQGKKIHVARVTVVFERSRAILVGPDEDNLTEMKQRRVEAYGEPTQLLTGSKEVTLEPAWESNGRIFARQRDPVPTTILAFIPDAEKED